MSRMNEKSGAEDVANSGAREPFKAKIVDVPDEVLPAITESQCWCCSEGCGETVPELVDHTYFEVREAESGNLIYARKGKAWASKCCEGDLLLWDNKAILGIHNGNFLEWKVVNAAEIEEAAFKLK